ncbi:lactoylglutathione lyase [Rhizobium oryzihabitans]|uniref:Lactoylglutathione lyase n=1 Tax=Rhizobium oryzihabitans TaxID=2267833 RepID=A0A7L5BJF9_9HYPH|nr:VOC family protein [Rhizobium oryzihabitans]QCM05628.1 lactoylglutathione lyase [Agrobacterium tumefaciens]QCM10791.1 lactoylglutathione lyase [Agrobacterium tumefaciens]QIB39011.1 lactoylglutathione lyase [Rhizobium oryzihabitans]CUX28804.1 lactoylglutathione lyase [Agrobacterium genomosp. 5 str. CFBP 6626]
MRPPAAIMETAIYADDLDAAEAFYRDVFGLEVVRRLAGQFVFFKCGRQMLLIFDPQQSRKATPDNPIPRHGATGQGHFCFYAKDKAEVDGWKARFEELGIAIEHYHHWPNDSYSVYIRDPAGNSVEVGEGKLWGFG